MNSPIVSIIIPTFNSEKHLNTCLQLIKKQSYPHVEIIVVDQQSSDQTITIAKKYKANIISIPKPKFYTPPSVSRNIGAKQAKGDILYHLDSDMIISKELILEIVEIFKTKKDIGALVVHEQDIPQGFWSKCKAFERKCYWGNDNIESARIVKKNIFQKVKGYDENISSGEDFDIHKKYKKVTSIGFCSNIVYHNSGSLDFFQLLYKKYNYGKSAHKYFKKNNSSGFSVLKDQIDSFWKNRLEFIKHPVIAIGTIILKLSEITAGSLGILQSKILRLK